MGALLQQQGRFAEAVGFLNKAAALRADDPVIQTLLHASQAAERLAQDRARQERVDRLVEELTQRYRQGDFVRPQAEADEWTSRPLTLWFIGLNRHGWVSFREGEDEFFIDRLTDVLTEQARVRPVERGYFLEKLLDELKLSTSALADPQTALRLGRLLSARLIATGSIATVGAEWQLTVRVVETETSAVSASIQQSFPLSHPIRAVADPVGKQLSEKLLHRYPLRARVLDVANGEVTLNIGAVDGAVPGLRLQLFREDARGLREDVAEVELVEAQEKRSRATVLRERVPVEVGLKARQLL
jgi:Curli production assembly/transport component CsgG